MKTEKINVGDLFGEISRLSSVEAIALGGSRAGENYDEKSDYDVYLYCTASVDEAARKSILEKYCDKIETGNSFWEYEDNCTLKNGIDIDILYRNLEDFGRGVKEVVENFRASNGYTTCMWHNLVTCKILYDRDGRLTALKERFSCDYPLNLKRNIIERNMKLLRYGMPAYEIQIAKAVDRGDQVSINHRVAEFLASYFDIIFALNERTHPGEKRLIELCEKYCKTLPANFRANLERLFSDMYSHPQSVKADVGKIIDGLEAVLNTARR